MAKKVTFLYGFFRGVYALFFRLWNRLRIVGPENLDVQGGVVLAGNHTSLMDPLLLGVIMPRPVHFLARDSLFKNKLARWALHNVCAIPLDRSRGDIGAIKKALEILADDLVLGLFPEGTRSPDGIIKEAKGGIGLIMGRSRVPVIPVYIDGSFEAQPRGQRWVRRHPVTVYVGPAIQPSEFPCKPNGRLDHREVGETVLNRIRDLKPPPS